MNMILSAVPVGVAVTSPSLAQSSLAAPASLGDVSFPALASRFATIFERWRVQKEIDAREQAAFEAECLKVTGIPFKDAPLSPYNDSTGYWDARFAINRDDGHPVDEHGSPVIWNEIHAELFEVVDQVLAQTPLSLADLALQAQAAAVANSELWNEDAEDVRGEPAGELRQLVDNLCRFASVDPLPGPLSATNASADASKTDAIDPIFAAIEAHRTDLQQCEAFLHMKSRMEEENRSPDGRLGDFPELDEKEVEWSDRVSDSAWELSQVMPTTARGIIAKLAFEREMREGDARWRVSLIDGCSSEQISAFLLSIENALYVQSGWPPLPPRYSAEEADADEAEDEGEAAGLAETEADERPYDWSQLTDKAIQAILKADEAAAAAM